MAGGFLGSVSGRVQLDIRQAVAAYATLRAQNARTVYALRGSGDAFVATGKVMTGAGLGLIYVFGKAVTAAAEFERKMDFFGAVTDTSAQKMQQLSKFTLQLAQDTIYSADQIAEGFIELGKAGVSAEQIMDGIGEAMANLGAAGDIPLAQSGQIITSTIQQFDLAATDAVKVVDLLAGAANASIADITDIGVSLKYVGGVANAVGLSVEDTTTAISLLAKAGIRGSTAGTSLRQMLVSLGGATAPATDTLKKLGIITEDGGNKFFTAEGKAKSLSQVFQILQKHTADLTQKERLMALRTIFNNRALSAASILTREGAAGFREMNKEMSKTTAAEVARKRLDNLSGDIEILKGNIETLFIQGGSPFQETLRGWVQSLTELVQAFSKLDPGTQKFIFQTIAITGAALALMGAFNIVIGSLLRFGSHMLKLGAAISFIVKWGRALLYVLGLIFGGAISAGALAIGAAVVAIGAAFVIAYKKIEPFRNFVNGIGSWFMDKVVSPIISGIGNLLGWFIKLAKDPKQAWEDLKSGVEGAITGMVGWFKRLPGMIGEALSSAAGAVGTFVGNILKWFLSLPGRVLGAVGDLASQLGRIFTFKNLGYAVGFAVGTIVKFFVTLPYKLLQYALQAVNFVFTAFASLPSRIGFVLGFLLGKVVSIFLQIGARMLSLGRQAITGLLSFFISLPGRIGAILVMAGQRVWAGLQRMVAFARAAGPRIVFGVINFVKSLPGRLVGLMGQAVSAVRNGAAKAIARARDMGRGIKNGVVNTIKGLPGTINGILGKCIAAFKGVVKKAFNAAKDFAGGLWKGFKAGLGINSPSFIEKQMVQITDVIGTETKRMRKQVPQIQAVGKKLASTQFQPMDRVGVPNLNTISQNRRVQGRAGVDLAPTALGRTGASTPGGATQAQGTNSRLVAGKITFDESGNAYIRGVAEDVVDDNNYYQAMQRRVP